MPVRVYDVIKQARRTKKPTPAPLGLEKKLEARELNK